MTPTPSTQHDDYARLVAGLETGSWDDHGQPAPRPDDIDEWRPTPSEPLNRKPGQNPY